MVRTRVDGTWEREEDRDVLEEQEIDLGRLRSEELLL